MGNELTLHRPPALFVLSGPSGVGKDTLIQELRRHFDDLHFATTATTRAPRPDEVPGKSYFFLTQPEYDDMLDRGELLAPAEVHGRWYGAPLDELRRAFARRQDVLLRIDVQGALQLRHRVPQAVFIFLSPPSIDELIQRLKTRHTESPQELARRIRDAQFEMDQAPQYDYVVINEERCLDRAVNGIACIITAERLRAHRQPIDLGSR